MKVDRFAHIRSARSAARAHSLGDYSKIGVTGVTGVTDEKPSENKGLLGDESVTPPENAGITDLPAKTSTDSRDFQSCYTVTPVTPQNIVNGKFDSACASLPASGHRDTQDTEDEAAAETTIESIARLDAERNERDRIARRGYDYDGRGDQSYQFEPGETVARVFDPDRLVGKFGHCDVCGKPAGIVLRRDTTPKGAKQVFE
jgi:hypothetical protein